MRWSVKANPYIRLMRFDKPVGIVLLLWPVLWSLWLSSGGVPEFSNVCLFVCGVIIMRAAGCIINDIADRRWDGAVERTRTRPLAQGEITVKKALFLFFVLISSAFALLLWRAELITIQLSFFALGIAIIYPFLKRVTHWPQLGLGVAFSVGVLMVFAEVQHRITWQALYVFFTSLIWPIIYDTWYAMVDYPDDVNVGIRSTAVRYHNSLFLFLAFFSSVFIVLLWSWKFVFHLNAYYDLAMIVVAMHAMYSLYGYVHHPSTAFFFRVFKQHQWMGLVIFVGVVLGINTP